MYNTLVDFDSNLQTYEEQINSFEVLATMMGYKISCKYQTREVVRIILFSKINSAGDFSIIVSHNQCQIYAHTHPKRERFYDHFRTYTIEATLPKALEIITRYM